MRIAASPVDSNEVHVTRRVYRSGEGEYLINRQPCRLKDIRELLAATGMTTEAYCIIEQGKVDALLQSSPRDRRIIFEEAAGISQFKAKKAVATRRMERVEQNLLRLSDIVDEVESRLKSIRSQAGKAKRYKECTERLQQLRTEVALVDWRHLTKQIDSRQAQSTELKRKVDERTTLLEESDAQIQSLEQRMEADSKETREAESLASATREQIAALQATLDGQIAQRASLLQEVDRGREQLATLDAQSGDRSNEELLDEAQQWQAAEVELVSLRSALQEHETQTENTRRELESLRREQSPLDRRLAECLQAAEQLVQEVASIEAEIDGASRKTTQIRQRIEELNGERQRRTAEFETDQTAEAEIKVVVDQHRGALTASEGRRIEVRRDFSRVDAQHRRTEGHLTRVRRKNCRPFRVGESTRGTRWRCAGNPAHRTRSAYAALGSRAGRDCRPVSRGRRFGSARGGRTWRACAIHCRCVDDAAHRMAT